MGWTSSYNWSNASDVKRELLSDYANSESVEILAHRSTSYGRHWWVAFKQKKTGRSFVCLFLLAGGCLLAAFGLLRSRHVSTRL